MSDMECSPSTPGSQAMQVAEQDNILFKKPVLPAPRKRKKVLDEETYVKELEKIIERDFFPDLVDLNEKVEYLEAKEANDIVKLREFYAKYSSEKTAPNLHNVEDSPATFETPVVDPANSRGDGTPLIKSSRDGSLDSSDDTKESSVTKKGADNTNISLDEFLSSHTSEDNASFEQIMKENERRFRLKYSWMFDAEEEHNKNHMPNLALPTIEQREEAARLSITGTSVQKDSRPKQIENWKFNTFNSVMFVPDGDEASQEKFAEVSKVKRREISLPNTRYEVNPFTETLSQAAMLEASAVQASKKEGKVGVDGKELGKDTPKINGYSFVTAPSPMPGVDASPLMTWGEVEGTPFQLDGNQTPLLKKQLTPGPSYRIPKVPNRDRLGHMLAEQVSLKHRNKKSKTASVARSSLGTPGSKLGHPSSSSERVTAMSPAAQRLLSSKLGNKLSGTDKALRLSYTPSPLMRRGSSTPSVETPKFTSGTPLFTSNTPKGLNEKPSKTISVPSDSEASASLTDNLLDLPKRPKVSSSQTSSDFRRCAADFF